MNLQQRISAFSRLGDYLKEAILSRNPSLDTLISEAHQKNQWFTPEHILFALNSIADTLSEKNLLNWTSHYRELQTPNSKPETIKRIGVLMAGNIPLVAFHDFLCVLISGNGFVGKLSSDDPVLLKYISEQLIRIEPGFAERIFFVERLDDVDVVIATGSNNTNRYFDYYFGKYPHLFRKNRNSVAILTGEETQEELTLLADDIFLYFGFGCRNVSKLFVPQGYDFGKFFPAMEKYSSFLHHNKYANNYNYRRTIYAMNLLPFLDNGFLVLKEDESFTSPVSVLFYEHYKNLDNVFEKLEKNSELIQCISVPKKIISRTSLPVVAFGETQKPSLSDYADGVDTLTFLLS